MYNCYSLINLLFTTNKYLLKKSQNRELIGVQNKIYCLNLKMLSIMYKMLFKNRASFE